MITSLNIIVFLVTINLLSKKLKENSIELFDCDDGESSFGGLQNDHQFQISKSVLELTGLQTGHLT